MIPTMLEQARMATMVKHSQIMPETSSSSTGPMPNEVACDDRCAPATPSHRRSRQDSVRGASGADFPKRRIPGADTICSPGDNEMQKDESLVCNDIVRLLAEAILESEN
jgi:hypothetical protein